MSPIGGDGCALALTDADVLLAAELEGVALGLAASDALALVEGATLRTAAALLVASLLPVGSSRPEQAAQSTKQSTAPGR